jgi:Transglutaminase-like superfamily.
MRIVILFVIGLFLIKETKSQGIYDVNKIPPDLLKDASLVIRYENQTYDIKNPGNAVYDYKIAVTLLNKSAEGASNMYEFYDKFSNVYNLKATLYDSKGSKVKEYKSSDFKDRSAVSSGSLYEDSRVKFLDFLYNNYPYTIEYSYSTEYSGIRFYPSWKPVSSWGTAVEKSEYTFRIPETMTFKYLKSTGLKTDSLKVKDKIQYKWSCENVKALEYEPMSAGIADVSPWVTLAPNQFEYDNSKANIENWDNLGAWLSGLNNGAQALPESVKLKVQNLIKGAATPKDKIKLLYNYLQSNTRYVGVQLGIGGYKPIAAEKVAAVNYGDCKALSNYMKALLQEAGIKSNLVVIGNDMPSLNKKFASLSQANHMILCVPLEKDTTWLECTSQFVPMGYIGNDNSDRTILLVTEAGGKLAQTPYYSPANNYQKRITKVNFDEEGSANISLETQYGFAQYEENLRMTLIEPTEQRKSLMNSLSIPNMQISSFSFNQPNKEAAVLNEKVDLKASQILTKGGDKLFLTLNMTNRQESAVTPIENRKTYFNVKYGYSDEDEIIYNIPKGYKVEFMPRDVVIESEFGKYTAKVVQKDNSLIYSRTKTINNKKYPPEKYNDYVAFSKKIYQADKQKGILAKIE